jgi:bla regulator protein BlaR1
MLVTLLQANYLSFFNWILTTSAKASIFIVFLLGVKFVLRHRMGARFQYMLWSVLMIGLVLPWTPSSPVSVNNFVNPSHTQQILAPISDGTTQPTPTVIDTIQSSVKQTAVVNSVPNKAALGTDKQLTSRNNVATFAIFPFIYKLMFLIWLLGILIFTVLTVLVNIRFCNKIEHNLVTDPRLITVYNQLKVELKIHELLHFKRRDIMINWLTQVLVIIHWFNPLIWYAFHRMREDQEIACDALAMERIDTEQSNDYAYTLIKLVETYSNAPRLAGLASLSGSKSQIRRRLTMIKDFRRNSVKWSVLGLLVIALIATAVFTSTANQGDSEAQAVVKEYKSKLYNVSYNSINWEMQSKIMMNINNFSPKMGLIIL